MYCGSCGFQNIETARFCARCGKAVAAATQAGMAPRTETLASTFQPDSPVATTPTYVPSVPATPGDKRYATGKTPWVAILLSCFIPGVGQFYNGDNKKGGVMIVTHFVLLILTPFGGISGFGVVGVWVWAMVDANKVAKGERPFW